MFVDILVKISFCNHNIKLGYPLFLFNVDLVGRYWYDNVNFKTFQIGGGGGEEKEGRMEKMI